MQGRGVGDGEERMAGQFEGLARGNDDSVAQKCAQLSPPPQSSACTKHNMSCAVERCVASCHFNVFLGKTSSIAPDLCAKSLCWGPTIGSEG